MFTLATTIYTYVNPFAIGAVYFLNVVVWILLILCLFKTKPSRDRDNASLGLYLSLLVFFVSICVYLINYNISLESITKVALGRALTTIVYDLFRHFVWNFIIFSIGPVFSLCSMIFFLKSRKASSQELS